MTETTTERTPVRVGTIVWGTLLLALAALSATFTLVDPLDYSPLFFIWVVVGFGALLLIGGIAGAIARAARKSRVDDEDGATSNY
jgi:hypothetical protein